MEISSFSLVSFVLNNQVIYTTEEYEMILIVFFVEEFRLYNGPSTFDVHHKTL